MSTAVVQKQETQALTIRQQVEEGLQRNADQFLAALGNDSRQVERWKSLTMTAIYRNQDLAACEPGSIVASVLEAAQFGLEFGAKAHSYLIPRGGKCTFMPSYRGLIHAAKRSGETAEIRAEAVYANDQFEYELGLDKRLGHRPATGDRGALTAVYAVVTYSGGAKDFEVMARSQVDHIKDKSSSPKGPWSTDYDEMAKKTVIKRLCKRLELSSDLADLMSLDDQRTIEAPREMKMPEEVSN